MVTTIRLSGSDTANTGMLNLFHKAWRECPELQIKPWSEFKDGVMREYSAPWYKFLEVFNADGLIGGIIYGDDYDVHVGKCYSIFMQYVLPEHRNKGVSQTMMRHFIKTAKRQGYKVIAWTHRTGDWTYKTTYRRI